MEMQIHSAAAEYLTYTAAVGGSESSMDMRYEDENIWLTQRMMSELYAASARWYSWHSCWYFCSVAGLGLAALGAFGYLGATGVTGSMTRDGIPVLPMSMPMEVSQVQGDLLCVSRNR